MRANHDEPEPELKVNQILEVARNGSHRVTAPIGCGGMGWVFEVVGLDEERAGKIMAVKVMHRQFWTRPDLLARFKRERSSTISIEHENILAVHGLFWTTNTEPPIPLIFMDRLRGQTLREVWNKAVRNGEQIPLQAICSIAHFTLDGLKAIHDRGLVHRDIKPENIFLDKRGSSTVIKIMDFGIVRERGAKDQHADERGMFIGTDEYSAPEQVRFEEVTERTDLYSFSVVLWELFAMRAMYPNKTRKEVRQAHLNEMPERLAKVAPHTPRALEQKIMAGLEKNPANRPANAAIYAEDFTRAFLNTAANARNSSIERALEGESGPSGVVRSFSSLPMHTVRIVHPQVAAQTTTPDSPPGTSQQGAPHVSGAQVDIEAERSDTRPARDPRLPAAASAAAGPPPVAPPAPAHFPAVSYTTAPLEYRPAPSAVDTSSVAVAAPDLRSAAGGGSRVALSEVLPGPPATPVSSTPEVSTPSTPPLSSMAWQGRESAPLPRMFPGLPRAYEAPAPPPTSPVPAERRPSSAPLERRATTTDPTVRPAPAPPIEPARPTVDTRAPRPASAFPLDMLFKGAALALTALVVGTLGIRAVAYFERPPAEVPQVSASPPASSAPSAHPLPPAPPAPQAPTAPPALAIPPEPPLAASAQVDGAAPMTRANEPPPARPRTAPPTRPAPGPGSSVDLDSMFEPASSTAPHEKTKMHVSPDNLEPFDRSPTPKTAPKKPQPAKQVDDVPPTLY